MTILTNKSELLFLYDVKDANPNGDPLDENKPRIDEESGVNIVTDVRLKRTVRDYLFAYKGFDGKDGKDIFVREIEIEPGGAIQDGKTRARDFDGQRGEILDRCIDVRLFGGTIPLPNDSITLTGPVQFKMGRSLHPVVMKHIQGTGAFASGDKQKRKTFRDEDILYYSLIAFHGIVNPAAAKHSTASAEDIELLLDAMWSGTKNLITRSKFGHMPRLLLKVNYDSPRFFIGDLEKYVAIESDLLPEQIRDVSQFRLETGPLKDILEKYADKIESVDCAIDDRLAICSGGESVSTKDLFSKFTCNTLRFD